MGSGTQRKLFGLSWRGGTGGLQRTASRWMAPLFTPSASLSRRPLPSGQLLTISPAVHPPGASSIAQRWSLATCLYALLLAACFTTALTAFHGLQTIAPTHGPVGDTWQSALEHLGLSSNPAATMAALVEPKGYPLEEHFITTVDGYILRAFRIPHGRSIGEGAAADPELRPLLDSLRHSAALAGDTRPVVLLQHALLDCSASWINNGPDQSLGFLLADAGFDVWMGNVRGNTFSRNHTTLPPSSEAFWAFSWDDMAAYDLPATVDYALKHSGATSLGYVGHSQGTTMVLAALSTQPSLALRISVAVLMAPVAFTAHTRSYPIRTMAGMDTEQVFEVLGSNEFLPSRKANHDAWAGFCAMSPSSCEDAIGMICGYNPDNVNNTRLPMYLSYTPAGTSVKNMAHWSQGVRRKEPQFLMYDYGTACRGWFQEEQLCNQHIYGQESPPAYDLGRITTPLMLVTGTRDQLSDTKDVEYLRAALWPGAIVAEHNEETYEHLDFTWAHNAHRLIYPSVMQVLAERSSPGALEKAALGGRTRARHAKHDVAAS